MLHRPSLCYVDIDPFFAIVAAIGLELACMYHHCNVCVTANRQEALVRRVKRVLACAIWCVQAITDQKRAWLEAQEQARGAQQLASWPQHLIDHFFVVVCNALEDCCLPTLLLLQPELLWWAEIRTCTCKADSPARLLRACEVSCSWGCVVGLRGTLSLFCMTLFKHSEHYGGLQQMGGVCYSMHWGYAYSTMWLNHSIFS